MITLDPYQVVSCEWLKSSPYRILADEPGVGKTHPAIFAAKNDYGPNLVVAPAYLLANWEHELNNSGEDDVVLVRGSARDKRELLLRLSAWMIVSYETFAKAEYNDILQGRAWATVIFDEAHRLKGRNSQRTKAAYGFRRSTVRMFMLTGTPIVANSADIFPLLKLCDPKKFSSYWTFVENNCRYKATPWGKKVGKPIDKVKFEEMLKPYMMRRTLKSVFPDMPPVIRQDILLDLDNPTAYKLLKKDYLLTNPDGKKTRVGAGGLVTALRRVTSQSKDVALQELLDDIPVDEQVVIFAWYRDSVDHLQELLPEARAFHGGFGQEVRNEIVESFKKGEFRILVASLSTLKEGVNLQNARYAIFYEEDWVEATNKQAIARLHRRGQEDTVFVYFLVTRKTVDASVHKAASIRGAMGLEDIFDDIWEE